MNRDFCELLSELSAAEARFLIVGAYALALHARPRATGDLDLWIEPTPENAVRVLEALRRFGAPAGGLTAEDFTTPEMVIQFGVEPGRVDLLTSLTGLEFGPAWINRHMAPVGGRDYPFLSRADLITNKRAVGRKRDLADLESLGE